MATFEGQDRRQEKLNVTLKEYGFNKKWRKKGQRDA